MIKNDWLMSEIALLRDTYAIAITHAELMALFPRHTAGSVHRMAAELGLSRSQVGIAKPRHGLTRLLMMLNARGPSTKKQIAEGLGICEGAVQNLVRSYRSELRVGGWEPPPRAGRWAPKWAVANGLPDVAPPFAPRGAKVGRKAANPFATAAGLIQPVLSSGVGRVFQQPMDIEEWGQSRAEAA